MTSLRILPIAAALAAAALPARAGTPEALALDPAFDGAADLEQPGMAVYHELGAAGRNDFGLGVFAADEGGYWLVVNHVDPAHVPSNSVFVARLADDGSYDESFGDDGEAAFDTLGPNGNGVVAVAKARDADTFYFAGPVQRADASGALDLGISCAAADGTPCAGFGDAGLVVVPILDATFTQVSGLAVDESGHVVAAGGCKIEGTLDPNGNLDICVVALDGSSGLPVGGFGTAGLSRIGVDVVEDGWDIPAAGSSLLVTGADSPTGARIFIAGGTQVTQYTITNPFAFVDDRAFIVALDAHTGLVDSSFATDGHVVVYDDGHASFVSALATTPDGNLLLAGQTATDTPGEARMLLAKLAPDGSVLNSFCGGEACIGNPVGVMKSTPRFVAARPGSGDILVAAEAGEALADPLLQAVFEADADGAWIASRFFDYSAATPAAQTGDVNGFMLDAQNRLVVLGERRWSIDAGQPVDSYDATLTRIAAPDAIFVDGFEP
jgi:hypothetical protein